MRLDCEVLSVSGNGDQLIVELQGARPDSAFWRRYGKHTLTLDDNKSARKAYYVGRRVIVDLSVRG